MWDALCDITEGIKGINLLWKASLYSSCTKSLDGTLLCHRECAQGRQDMLCVSHKTSVLTSHLIPGHARWWAVILYFPWGESGHAGFLHGIDLLTKLPIPMWTTLIESMSWSAVHHCHLELLTVGSCYVTFACLLIITVKTKYIVMTIISKLYWKPRIWMTVNKATRSCILETM